MGILSGMTITEHGAFIAGPFSTLSLAKLGANVIRIDPIGGGIDYRRWPISADGHSLYWSGLNKGKKSIAIDLRRPEGQDLAQTLITAPGDGAGLFVTNFPAIGWLDYETLRSLRQDLIMATVLGNYDGSTAVDYTVNCAVGFPLATGPEDMSEPINHVLPAWDLLCGQTVAMALLAAERYRRVHGHGQLFRVALSDVALAAVSDLGMISEVEINGSGRSKQGNQIYGAYGCDFATKDGRRVMVAAVSRSQWRALCKATEADARVREMEDREGCDLNDEGERFRHREAITALLTPWFGDRSLAQIGALLDRARVCWGVYQTFEQMVAEDPRCSMQNPMFESVNHNGIGLSLTARSPIQFSRLDIAGNRPLLAVLSHGGMGLMMPTC